MAAVKGKKKKISQKTPPKAVPTWEELLVEKALAMITETDRQIDESAQRYEQRMKEKGRQVNESAQRYEHQIKETVQQNKWKMTEITGQTDRDIKGSPEKSGLKMKKAGGRPYSPDSFSENSGDIDLPNLMRKFRELGFVFDKSYKEAVINDKKNNISIEIDITLESANKVMIVKTKNRPSDKDITGHIERIRKVRQYGDLHGEKRKYLGAICGTGFNNEEKLFTIKNGLYIIEPSGKTFTITAPEGIYFPGEW